MIRVVISLDSNDKAWLQHVAEDESISMAEVIRHAIHYYRVKKKPKSATSLQQLLSETKGIWEHGDGLSYQRKIRSEWEK